MKVVITPDDDWFPNPLDSMPIARDLIDTSPSEIQPPGVDQPIEEITIHEKMYREATKNGGSWMQGGSENFVK